jgi:hypothetical protein
MQAVLEGHAHPEVCRQGERRDDFRGTNPSPAW